jgi:hypothetical protein
MFHIPYILACHLQIDADQGPNLALIRVHADPDPQHRIHEWVRYR